MFGGGAEVTPVEEPAVDTSGMTEEEAVLFGPRTTNADIADRLDTADKALTLGGKLTMRTLFDLPEAPELSDVGLSSPNLLYLFLDARPDDRTRAYIQGRLTHDWTVTDGAVSDFGTELSTNTVALDQLWLKFDVGRRVFFTIGRQPIKWGTGRFWNPTDFLNQEVRDPLAVFDTRTGVSLVKAHVPIGRYVNVYGVASLEQAYSLDRVGGAARIEALVGNTEGALSAAVRKDEPLRLGADLSTALWIFDLRAELGLQHGVTDPFWVGDFDIDSFTLPDETSREDDWIPQVVAGADVTFKLGDEDTLTLGAEYFYNDAGYTDPDIYAWLFLQGQYQPFYLGQQYVGAYALLPAPGRLDDHSFVVTGLANLSDQTGLVRVQHSWNALTWLDITTYLAFYLGEQGEFKYSLSVPAVPGYLDEPIELVPTQLGGGVWASVRF